MREKIEEEQRSSALPTAKALQESRAGITWEVTFVVIRRNSWGMASKGQPRKWLGGASDGDKELGSKVQEEWHRFEPPEVRWKGLEGAITERGTASSE